VETKEHCFAPNGDVKKTQEEKEELKLWLVVRRIIHYLVQFLVSFRCRNHLQMKQNEIKLHFSLFSSSKV